MLHTFSFRTAGILLSLGLTFISCKKENHLSEDQRLTPTQKAKSNEESLLTSVVRTVQTSSKTESFRQLEVSYDSGRTTGIVNFAFGDGSVRFVKSYGYDAIGRLTSTTVKNEGRFTYVYNEAGQIAEGMFTHQSDASKNYRLVYTRGSNDSTVTEDRFDHFSFGVERIMYKFNPDGTFKSIEIFDPQNGMKLKGKVILQNSYDPKQLAAWKRTVSKFPEPTLPMPVITMLAAKIEMFADGGYCCDDVIVDGRIITAQNVQTNFAGQIIRKRIATADSTSGGGLPMETISFNYGK